MTTIEASTNLGPALLTVKRVRGSGFAEVKLTVRRWCRKYGKQGARTVSKEIDLGSVPVGHLDALQRDLTVTRSFE